MKVVMFTCGNPARGDDGVGTWFADRFRSRTTGNFNLVEDVQLQIEHLLDCQSGHLLLFVDARCDDGLGLQFEELEPSDDLAYTSHALSAAQLLGQYRRVFDSEPPPAFQLSVPGSDFALGREMSAAAQTCCQRGRRLVEKLLVDPRLDLWRARATLPPPEEE